MDDNSKKKKYAILNEDFWQARKTQMSSGESAGIFSKEQDKCVFMCCSKQKFLELCKIFPDSAISIEITA